ncbi:hypothetical protein Bca101_051868 [Brassica carinata]
MISNPAQIRHNSGEFPHLFRSQSSYAPTIPNPICSLCFCETLDVGGEEDLLLFNGRRGYKFTRELLATSEMEASRRNSISSLFKMDMCPSLYQTEWWEWNTARIVQCLIDEASCFQLLGASCIWLKSLESRRLEKDKEKSPAPCGGHLPPSPVVDAKKSMSAAKLANQMMKRQLMLINSLDAYTKNSNSS